jgi:chromosome segregation ATPase
MNYEHKYLKYKEKYLALKAEVKDSVDKPVDKPVDYEKIIKARIARYNESITKNEQNVKEIAADIISAENKKNIGLDTLKKNNAPQKEIDDFILKKDKYINSLKGNLKYFNDRLESQKRRLEYNKKRLNNLSKK